MTEDQLTTERVQPELVDQSSDGPSPDGLDPADAPESADGTPSEEVSRPSKLIRIASMVRGLLDEVRRAPLDDAGRRTLREIHERSMRELEGILSDDLRAELTEVVLPFSNETPSESELRIAQAQLVGWLEGLFHGIQATLFTQQMTAQAQFEEMQRRRAIGGPEMQGSEVQGPTSTRAPASGPSGYL